MKDCNMLLGERANLHKIFLSEKRENNGILVAGGMGRGKTQTAVMLLCNKNDYQGKKIAFNWRRCLDRDTLMPNVRRLYESKVQVIDVKRDGLGIPLFEPLTDKDGNTESKEDVICRISNLFNVACNMQKTPSYAGKFKDAVEAKGDGVEFAKNGAKCFARWLKAADTATADKTLARVDSLCKYIKDGNFIESEAEIIELDLNGLYPEDQKSIVEFVIEYVNRLGFTGKFMEDGITLYVDEAQNLNYEIGAPVRNLLNEGRRMGVDIILAVQSLKYTDIKGYDVIRQCATKIFFKPIDGEEKLIAKMIAERRKIDATVVVLKELTKGEYLAHGYFKYHLEKESKEELFNKQKEAKTMTYPGIVGDVYNGFAGYEREETDDE